MRTTLSLDFGYPAVSAAGRFIKETKYGLTLDRFPCQEFHANWAYLTIGMLAYNIVNWIKRLALPSMYKKRLIKALRYRFFNNTCFAFVTVSVLLIV
jgi:hypothetical protein